MLLLKPTITIYLCLKHMTWKRIKYHVSKFGIVHMHLKTKYKKIYKQVLSVHPKAPTKKKEKEKEKNIDYRNFLRYMKMQQ